MSIGLSHWKLAQITHNSILIKQKHSNFEIEPEDINVDQRIAFFCCIHFNLFRILTLLEERVDFNYTR